MPERNFYEILGVDPASEQEVIDAAYRALMRKYHPDRRFGDTEALARAREINSAYETLGDPRKRAEYNLKRPGPGTSVSIFTTKETSHSDKTSADRSVGGGEYKRCIECDEEIRVNARTCRFCGSSLGRAGTQNHTTNVHTHVYPSSPPVSPPRIAQRPLLEAPRERSGFGCMAAIIVIALLVMLAAMLGNTASTTTNDAIADNSMNTSAINATPDTNEIGPQQSEFDIPQPSPDESAGAVGLNAPEETDQLPPDGKTDQTVNTPEGAADGKSDQTVNAM